MGWFSYFLIVLYTRSEYPTVFKMLLHSLKSNLSTIYSKKLLIVLTTFWYPEIVVSFLIRVTPVELGASLESKGLIVFQRFLICYITYVNLRIHFFPFIYSLLHFIFTFLHCSCFPGLHFWDNYIWGKTFPLFLSSVA